MCHYLGLLFEFLDLFNISPIFTASATAHVHHNKVVLGDRYYLDQTQRFYLKF